MRKRLCIGKNYADREGNPCPGLWLPVETPVFYPKQGSKKALVALCRTHSDRNIGWQEDDLLSQGVIEKQHQRGVGQLIFLTYIKYSQAVKKSKPVGTNLFSVQKHAARCTTSNRTYDCLRRCAKKTGHTFSPEFT
jgi:hypothetical protein